MGDVCANCASFDYETTSLPICAMHHRYTHAEWTCGDFACQYGQADDHGEEDDDATA